MRKCYFLFLCLMTSFIATSQTIVWSSNLDDEVEVDADFSREDRDGDGFNWLDLGINPTGSIAAVGFSEGRAYLSSSSDGKTPDNVLLTPSDISIPVTASEINFKMRVGAQSATLFSEKYAVYVYDGNLPSTYLDTQIYEETLTEGGAGTAKDIVVTIPESFAGKTIGLVIRHYDCTGQQFIIIDDLEVSYSETLGVDDNDNNNFKLFPNPVKDVLNLTTNIKQQVESILIFNQLGQQVKSIEKTNIVNDIVDLSDLVKGIYLIKLKSNFTNEFFTIVKE